MSCSGLPVVRQSPSSYVFNMRFSLQFLSFLLFLLSPSAEAGFFLKADFVWYNNSLDTYPDISSGDSEDCCFNQRSCSDDCITRLRYCFKEYKTVTNISNDKFSGTGCNGTRFSSLLKPVEFIDYSEPPRDMTHNNTISRSITYRGSDDWPGKLQLFVRAAVGQYVIEYFQFDFELGLNDPPLNGTVEGTFYGSNMTFAFVLTLTCLGNFYGPNCSVYCKPENSSKGHYRCLDDGSKECLTGYKNVSNNCVTCVPAEGCLNGYCEIPGDCICFDGYTGEKCERADITDTNGDDEMSTVEIVGLLAGCGLLLLTLCVLIILVVIALRKRIHHQSVDPRGSRDEKLPSEDSYSQESGMGLMDNPMYEVCVKGTHLPLGKSPSLELGVEHDVQNPLYMLGATDNPSNGHITNHDYDYATADEVQPASFIPPLAKEFEMYAEPNFGATAVPGPSSPYSQPHATHHYQEPTLTPPPHPAPIYDDPLSLPETKQKCPAILENHYDSAEDVLEVSNNSQYTIYDSDKEN